MQITKDLVEKIAKLARIRLAENEVEKFTEQLGAIVGFVEKLNSVDTSGVAETNQITGLENILRADEVAEFPEMKKLVECSNHPIENGQIKIKKSI